jgi:hypothetical protein
MIFRIEAMRRDISQMRYMASMYLSDVMESVALTIEVQGWSEQFGPPEVILQKTFVWQGIGETRPEEWVARALFMASEGLTTARSEGSERAAAMGGHYTISETGDSGI